MISTVSHEDVSCNSNLNVTRCGVARQVAGKTSHYAALEKYVSALSESLRKVEVGSTVRNNCANVVI